MGKKWMRDVQRSFESKAPTTQYFDPDPDLGGDESRENIRSALLQAADDQIRDYPAVTATFARLTAEGISEQDARLFIANLVARQIAAALNSKEPFDEELYQSWLDQLPELPDDD